MVVDLPAPLGPMKPKQSPSLISRLRFERATSVPYRLVRLTVLITAAMSRPPWALPARPRSPASNRTDQTGAGRTSSHPTGAAPVAAASSAVVVACAAGPPGCGGL